MTQEEFQIRLEELKARICAEMDEEEEMVTHNECEFEEESAIEWEGEDPDNETDPDSYWELGSANTCIAPGNPFEEATETEEDWPTPPGIP